MSLSPAYSAVNLYCREVADEVVDLSDRIPFPNLDSSTDDESFILGLLILSLIKCWVLNGYRFFRKVHSHYNFRPETAYLSVTYLDRFLCTYDLPEWSLQLLSVPCIALAVKMEGMSAPLPLDLQVMEPRFLFTAMTGQQMEIVTPFSFVSYFISKQPRFFSQFYSSSNVSDLILASCRVTDHLDFLPSSIAAASLLWVAGKNVDDQILEHFHKRLNKEMVKRCHYLIKQSMCSMVRVKRQRLEPGPPSPDGVLDADISKNCDVLKCGGEDSKSSQD
ncbi:hypothetical protein AAG906_024231 [Vitis piasezkii]